MTAVTSAYTDRTELSAIDDIETLAGIFGLGQELSWQERALCNQTDPEAFFPEKGGSTREAKKICTGCSVRGECLEYALKHEERFGIWGGLSERERRRLNKRSNLGVNGVTSTKVEAQRPTPEMMPQDPLVIEGVFTPWSPPADYAPPDVQLKNVSDRMIHEVLRVFVGHYGGRYAGRNISEEFARELGCSPQTVTSVFGRLVATGSVGRLGQRKSYIYWLMSPGWERYQQNLNRSQAA